MKFAKHVHSLGLPVPHVIEKREENGRVVIIYSYVDGPSGLHKLLNESAQYRSFAQMLATLHAQIHKKTSIEAFSRMSDRVLVEGFLAFRNS